MCLCARNRSSNKMSRAHGHHRHRTRTGTCLLVLLVLLALCVAPARAGQEPSRADPLESNPFDAIYGPASAPAAPTSTATTTTTTSATSVTSNTTTAPLARPKTGPQQGDLSMAAAAATIALYGGALDGAQNSSSPRNSSAANMNDLVRMLSANASLQATSDKDFSDSVKEQRIKIGVMCVNAVIFAIGLCGNAIVIMVILKFTRTETVTDIYILNLAFADIMFITGLVFLITTMLVTRWIFGNLMCKVFMATTSVNQFASSLLLVVMSFDRFLAVCHPIYAQEFRRPRRAKIICLGIWIICLILMTPIFVFAKVSEDPNEVPTCAIFWPEHWIFNCEVAFTFYSFTIGFASPLLLIAAFYTRVILKLRNASHKPTLGRSRVRASTNKRIENLVIGVIGTYLICWLPYWIAQICLAADQQCVSSFYEFILVATSLCYTNSALNPILYAFLSDNFKRRCSLILQSLCPHKCFKMPASGSATNLSCPQARPDKFLTCRKSEPSLARRASVLAPAAQSRSLADGHSSAPPDTADLRRPDGTARAAGAQPTHKASNGALNGSGKGKFCGAALFHNNSTDSKKSVTFFAKKCPQSSAQDQLMSTDLGL